MMRASRLWKLAGVGVLALWFPAVLVMGATLMVGHWYTLPRPPTQSPAVATAVSNARPAAADGWVAFHFLLGSCPCSQRVFDHLLTSDRPTAVYERVFLVGRDPSFEAAASRHGLEVEVLHPAELQTRFHLESAPLMLVADPEGVVRYLGGYTARKQGPDIRDLAIIDGLLAQRAVQELPLFGCAVSQRLQELLDPLGIKYSQESS